MTNDLPAPVGTIKGALYLLPPAALGPGLRLLMRSLRARHPSLFRRLSRLAPATILFEPDDTPHCFLLTIRRDRLDLSLAPPTQPAMARIKGTLGNLLRLMEGRVDSDTLFFSRDVVITGDTAVAVGFRNTLDGESISLFTDLLAALGPFARPGERLLMRADRHVGRIRSRLRRWRDSMHRAAHGGHDTAEENRALAAEIAELRQRIVRLEAGRRRREQAA